MEKSNQSLNTKFEKFKKDLLMLESELNKKQTIKPIGQSKRMAKYKYQKFAEENKILMSKQQQQQQN